MSSLMMIYPNAPEALPPILDDVTRKAAALLRTATRGESWRGIHTCMCGANSGSCDLYVGDRVLTNSLLVHYVAHHRDEIPAKELAELARLTAKLDPVEPTAAELAAPKRTRHEVAAIRRSRDLPESHNRIYSDYF